MTLLNGEQWVAIWAAVALGGFGGAFGLDFLRRRRATTYWLFATLLLGSGLLVVMAGSLHYPSPLATIVLPSPFPTMVLHPLPLGALWSALGGLLFGAAALGAFKHIYVRQIYYSLLAIQVSVAWFLWSGDGLYLLVTWEMLSMASYLGLVATRKARPVWRAGWIFLTLSELGGILLLAALLFITPHIHGQFYDSFSYMAVIVPHIGLWTRNLIMSLVLLAFGVKAGLFPVMIWMPLVEPEVPGAVAGIFSGLLTALAVSGILQMASIFRPSVEWGSLLIVLGILGAFTAAAYSIVARHIKRILAYSTLEILGVVFAGMGIWQVYSSLARGSAASTMALVGTTVLLVMHAGAKFLLFLSTDGFNHNTQLLDRLGGAIRRNRPMGYVVLAGIVIIGAIPPLGGFVGEWLVLESLFFPVFPSAVHLMLMAAGVILAITMALGVTAYLRWYAFIFLGKAGAIQEEPNAPSRTGHQFLAALWTGVLPGVVVGPGLPWFLPWLVHQLTQSRLLYSSVPIIAHTKFHPSPAVHGLIAIGANLVPTPGAPGSIIFPSAASVGDPWVLGWMVVVLVGIVAFVRAWRRPPVRMVESWTGGLASSNKATSYSSEGFVHPLRLALAAFYGLKRERRDVRGSRYYRHTIIDRLERQFYGTIVAGFSHVAQWVRLIQNGQLAWYLFYQAALVLVAIFVVGIHGML